MAATFNTSVNFIAPPLPFALDEYDQAYYSQYKETLRLYFNQVDGALGNALSQEYSESVAWFMG